MGDTILPYRFVCKRDTAANFEAANTLLKDGEIGVVTDSGNPRAFKEGDGVTAWNSLPVRPMQFAAAAGTNTITATFIPKPVPYDGMLLQVRAAAANTGAATFNPNGLGALAIQKQGGTALSAGDIAAAGHELLLRYVAGSPAHYELINPAGTVGGAVAGSATSNTFVLYNGTVQAGGKWDGGTSNPVHTARLNYDGYLYATRLVGTHFGDGSNLTGISGAALNQNTLPYAVQTIAMRGSWAYGWVHPSPASVTSSTFGIDPSVGTVLGSGSTVAVAATSAYTRQIRRAYASSTTVGSSTGVYVTTSFCCGAGGFYFATRFGIADAASVANARLFVGLRAATATPTNVNPSSLTDIICVGADSGDANLQVIYNDSSGTATKIDLGAAFPANTRSTDFYEVQFLSLPGGTSVQVYVLNVVTGASALNVLTTDIPAAATMLNWAYIRNNGTTALAVKLEVGGWAWGMNLEP